jgi:hypothetical protein
LGSLEISSGFKERLKWAGYSIKDMMSKTIPSIDQNRLDAQYNHEVIRREPFEVSTTAIILIYMGIVVYQPLPTIYTTQTECPLSQVLLQPRRLCNADSKKHGYRKQPSRPTLMHYFNPNPSLS